MDAIVDATVSVFNYIKSNSNAGVRIYTLAVCHAILQAIDMVANKNIASVKPTPAKDLLLLFSVPIAVVLLTVLIIYVPRLAAHPAYSFLYSYCLSYGCDTAYSIGADNQLQQLVPPTDIASYGQNQTLALYDPSTGASKTMTYAEAQSLQLINSTKSPDGYSLAHSTGDSGFLFWDNYQDSWQLENGLKKKAVQLAGMTNDQSAPDVTFIGWVQK